MRRGIRNTGWFGSRDRLAIRSIVLIVIILAVLLAISFLRLKSNMSKRIDDPEVAQYTTYGTGWNGTKALYLLLRELGYKTERLRTPSFASVKRDGMTVVISPTDPPIEKAEVERLLKWVNQGNTLLFIPNGSDGSLTDVLRIGLYKSKPSPVSIAPSAFTAITSGIKMLKVRSGNRLSTSRPDPVYHFRDDEGGVVISFSEGLGTIIVMSDHYLVSNSGLPDGDNLRLLINILSGYVAESKTVYFDEYHHGFGKRQTIPGLLRNTSLGWAVVYALVAIVLLMYSRGRRFGRPKPDVRESRRSSIEYVNSLAGIYQTADARGIALSNLCEWFLYGKGLEKSRTNNDDIKKLIDECKGMIKDGNISDNKLIELSKRMEKAQRLNKGD